MPSTSLSPPSGQFSALVADNVVATVAVIPDSQIVFVGDRFRITARPKNAAGQVLTRTVRWTVGTPTVAKALDSLKAIMPFKALRTGSTLIKATVDGISRSAKVVVRSTAGAKVILTPAQTSLTSGSTAEFVASGLTQTGEKANVQVVWSGTGGTVSTTGVYKAGTVPGTYRVIATSLFGAADTAAVTVVAPTSSPVVTPVMVPERATVEVRGKLQFVVYGRTSTGDSVSLTASYTATGGTIATSGLYTAGTVVGTYRVIARTPAGAADTAEVAVTPEAIARLVLQPDVAASRTGATIKFAATPFNGAGLMLPEPVTYQSTCGTIGSDGTFVAPSAPVGACMVVATAGTRADTTEVALLNNSPRQGLSFGTSGLWSNPITPQPAAAPFTASIYQITPTGIVDHITAARAQGIRLVLSMTGGSHDRYKTNGAFDDAKWRAVMDGFNTPAIRSAVADGVADGTILGASVMDEPQQSDGSDSDPSKTWGPKGTMTKVRVDGLCGYVHSIFPSLPAGVFHDPLVFERDSSYRVCQFMVAQYATRKGNVVTWRDAALAITHRDHMAIMFSLNVLDGGTQDRSGVYDCAGTGGLGTYAPNCAMTPEQIWQYGQVIGPAGCALLSWRYTASFMSKPENQAAFSRIATRLAELPWTSCAGTRPVNAAPVAAFTSTCNGLDCSFTDESTDSDGILKEWSWDFGDGTRSSVQHPNHSYAAAGTYEVTLAVSDNGAGRGSVTKSVTVRMSLPPNIDPEAAFSATCTELACAFADESGDQDGSVESWSWSFGDGETSTSRHPTHTYSAGGDYLVTLTVTDEDGGTGSVTHGVRVSAPPPPPTNASPQASFTWSCTGLQCRFIDESTDKEGMVASWNWDFGDGTSSSEQHPSHTYAEPGDFQVTLVVLDEENGSGTRSDSLRVTSAPEEP